MKAALTTAILIAMGFGPSQGVPKTGTSIVGRVVPEQGTVVPSPVGLRVSATPPDAPSKAISATVAPDWSFRMTGPSGPYELTASADREPFVKATRVTVDGAEQPSTTDIALTEGAHDVVVFVKPRERGTPWVDRSLPTPALVDAFMHEEFFSRQLDIARAIVERRDASVLPGLVSFLAHNDRHIRGNAAFMFAALGDSRGFPTIVEILSDRSYRSTGQDVRAAGNGQYRVESQIAADRYYAAHLLGDLRDPRAIPILVPLLKDREVNSIVPWSLGQIGGTRAVGPLIDALDDDDPSMRVLSIYGLEALGAREALPRLTALLDDHRQSNFGAQVTVANAAAAAIAKLK
jgi:HEAT repeats